MTPVLVRGTDFRFDPISGKAEAASGPAQFGSTFDEFGNRFITQNTTHIRHVVLPMRYLARAPLLEVAAEAQDISDHGRPSARMFPLTHPQEWRKERTSLRQERYDENELHRTEEVGGWFTAASGSTLYSGDAWPKEYLGNVFTGDVSGNLIHRDLILPDGATLRAHRAKDNVEFLASTDVWFRPCNFANAPDGNFYFTDIYRQVIETPESIPEEIRKKINFYNGDTLGRIYRIVPNNSPVHRNLQPNLGTSSSADLVVQLANPNGWNRWTAHRLLLERQDKSIIPKLQDLAANGSSPEARMHALALLDAFSALQVPEIEQALKDADGRVRQNAVRLSEPALKQSKPLANAVLAAASDSDPHVQFQAALTLGDLKDPQAFTTLAQLAHQHSSDQWFRDAILSSVADSASPFYEALLAKGETWTDPQLLVRLSALIGSRHNENELSRWFAGLAKLQHPDKELAGLTRGLELVRARNLPAPGAEAALAKQIEAGNEPVRRAAWEASWHFKLDKLLDRAMADATNVDLPEGNRILAIRALRGGQFRVVAPIFDKVLAPNATPNVEVAAMDSLAAFDDPAVAKMILAHWANLSPQAHERGFEALVGHKNRVPILLQAVEAGKLDRAALDGSVRSHLYENPDPDVVSKAHALLGGPGSDRAQVVTRYQAALTTPGNAFQGKIVFQANCARCHMPRIQGGRVGPDLSGINNKTKEELLTDILNPSYAIEPTYINHVAVTKDGYIYDGIISNETPGAITLRSGAESGDQTLLRSNIQEIRSSTVSLMPEGFEKTLNEQDMANVIAYLRGGL
jgi:putative heme-binding domain-containing protein